MATFETCHIVHILEQLLRGYLTASNCNHWSKQLFGYDDKKNKKNVNTYFYRFEFQNRGTVHLQMLVWLKDILKTNYKAIRADIPWENASLTVHPAEAFKRNLRAYIVSILPALDCRMEVQTTDGKGMVLRYCSSYVSKWHDAFDPDALFSIRKGPYQCAYKHLPALRPLEPEMSMSLGMKKLAWSQSRTKRDEGPRFLFFYYFTPVRKQFRYFK